MEVREAIASGDRAKIDEELGDVLMNVMCLAIENERSGGATVAMVLVKAIAKLRLRKPWIFDLDAKLPQTAAEEHRWFRLRKAALRKKGYG